MILMMGGEKTRMGILSNMDASTIFSILATFVSCAWTGYTYYHGEKTSKELEKMKGEQGKSLESFKIFTKQRHERIIAFYESLYTLLGACGDLSEKLNTLRHPDFMQISEDDFKEYLDSHKILKYDKNILIQNYRDFLTGKISITDLENELYMAFYNKYALASSTNASNWLKLRLYISTEDEEIINQYVDRLGILFHRYLRPSMKKSELIHKECNEPYGKQCLKSCEELAKEMTSDIIPRLRKNLREYK